MGRQVPRLGNAVTFSDPSYAFVSPRAAFLERLPPAYVTSRPRRHEEDDLRRFMGRVSAYSRAPLRLPRRPESRETSHDRPMVVICNRTVWYCREIYTNRKCHLISPQSLEFYYLYRMCARSIGSVHECFAPLPDLSKFGII